MFVGLPVFASFEAVPKDCDGVIVTDPRNASDTLALASAMLGLIGWWCRSFSA